MKIRKTKITMKIKKITPKKELLYSILISFSLVLLSLSNLAAQINLVIDTTCVNLIQGGCPTFYNKCYSLEGWSPSHGTPQLVYWRTIKYFDLYSAFMIGVQGGSEGMFTPFSFVAGQTYMISVNCSVSGDPGVLSLYAANNLQQHTATTCQESPQNITTKQIIGELSSDGSIIFTSNNNYSQFWMFATLSSGTQFNVSVTGITITPICDINAPTGLGISNSGSTFNWNVVSGASSYKIIVSETYNDATFEKILYSNVNHVDYCAEAGGNQIHFEVYGMCGNNALGPSSGYSFISSNPIVPVKPEGLYATNISSSSAVLNWNAQPGVTFYGSYYGGGGGSIEGTTSNSYTLSNLLPNTTYTCYLSAYNVCSASAAATFSFTTLTTCPTPAGSPYGQPVGNSIYLYFPTTPAGCSSYNLKYKIYGTTQEYTISNIPTTSPYILNNLVHGNQYQFSIQCNCSDGMSGSYGPWSQTPTYFYRSTKPLESLNNSMRAITYQDSLAYQDSLSREVDINNVSKELILYPNPAKDVINILFKSNGAAKPELIIMNTEGTEVMKKYLNYGKSKSIQSDNVDINMLNSGVYILKLRLGSKVLTRKLVVQK